MISKKSQPEAVKASSTPFDKTYKESFSRPEMVENLVRGYGPKKLIRFFDFSTLEEFPTEKIGSFGEEYRNDKLWKCKYRNRDSYILIMLEFQSSNDKFMALRIRAYIDGIWNYLARHGMLKQGELPLFLPILIYNGQYKWTAPLTIDELLGEIPEELRPYQHGRYHLVDVGRLSQEIIESDKSPLSTLMKLEQAKTFASRESVKRLLYLMSLDHATKELSIIWFNYMSDLEKRNPAPANREIVSSVGGNDTMYEANIPLIIDDIKRDADQQIAVANRKTEEAVKKIVESVKNLLALGTLSLEQIAQAFNMSIEQVKEIKSGMTC